jgi:hypothetical protein
VTVSPSAFLDERTRSRLDRRRGHRSVASIVVLMGLMVAGCSGGGGSDSGDDQDGGDSIFVPVDGAVQIAVTEEQRKEIEEECTEEGGIPGLGCHEVLQFLPESEPCTPQPGESCVEIDFGPDPGSALAQLTIYPAETDPDDCSGPPCFSTTVSAEATAMLEERVLGDEPTTESTTPDVPTESTTSPTPEEESSGLPSSPAESSS